MLSLRISQPTLASTQDKQFRRARRSLPAPDTDFSSSSSDSSTSSKSTDQSIDSQRILDAAKLQSRKPTAQARPGKDARKTCLVCWSKDCNLKSHFNYASKLKPQSSENLNKKETPAAKVKLTLPIGNGRLDPFTALPVEGPTKETLQLFHDFFTKQSSQVHTIPKRLAFDSTYTPLLLQQAFADPATFYSCLAMAETYRAVHGRNLRAPDETLSAVYETALRALRAQLIREKAKPRTTTVMAAVNLIMSQAIGMSDKEALVAHQTGIQSFVQAWGGIHNLEPQLVSLIIWTDYWATLFTGIPPSYTHLLSTIDIKLENPPPRMYGLAFEEPRLRGMISPLLLKNCQITCRLVELVEDKINNTSTPARWQYWVYKRDSMATRNAVVHSELFGAGNKAECIGITMNMILILTLRMVPWKSPANELCDQIKVALIASGAPYSFWRLDIDILLYILFTVSAAGVHWHQRDWAMALLQRTLEAKYGLIQADWPTNWEEQEGFNVRRFAWSEMLLGPAFRDTCREISLSWDCDLADDEDSPHSAFDV